MRRGDFNLATDEGMMETAEGVITVTDDNFEEEVVSQGVLTLVDFWAEWCGPCRMVAPIVEQLASEYAGDLRVAKLDVDENPRTAQRFNVRSIPSILFFKDGEVVETVIGAVPKAQLEGKVQQHK